MREGEKPAGHVFISYVHEDARRVDQLQRKLEAAGVRVWRDKSDLWPGEDWRTKIRRAITDNALVFIVCFSKKSLARDISYQNEELALAIEQLRLRPPENPWLIPVRFDECEIPDRDIGGRRLTSIQCADLFGRRSQEDATRLLEMVQQILGPYPEATSTAARTLPTRERSTGRVVNAGPTMKVHMVLERTVSHAAKLNAVAFRPDGSLATASEDRTARLWDLANGQELFQATHEHPVGGLACSPNGRLLATGDDNGDIRLWDIDANQATFIGVIGDVFSLAFSRDGRLLAVGTLFSGHVLHIGTGRPRRLIEVSHGDRVVRGVDLSPDGGLLATGGDDRTARLWETATGDKRGRVKHNADVRSVAFHPKGPLASGSEDNTARLWETATGRELSRVIHEGTVYSVAFSPDGHMFATGSEDNTAGLWETVTGRELARVSHEGTVYSVAFSRDGRMFATGSEDGTARAWSLARSIA